jgi:hypothetical protein
MLRRVRGGLGGEIVIVLLKFRELVLLVGWSRT